MKALKLKKLQQQFIVDIISPSNNSANYIISTNFSSSALLNIYRNNYYNNLISALRATYSCIDRLVGTEFFDFIAKKYIKKNPSISGNIIDYGNNFADFIKNSTYCNNLPYLADIAKLEYYYDRCYYLGTKATLSSKYPIISIWQLDENSENININSGGNNIRIYRKNLKVIVEKIC